MDHTTIENLGQQNMFFSSLNTLNPELLTNFVPIFSHDQKENFLATKVIAKPIVDQLSAIGDPERPVTLDIHPLPENHITSPQTTQNYIA